MIVYYRGKDIDVNSKLIEDFNKFNMWKFSTDDMEYCRIDFNNRNITIDRMLMADFEKHYGKQLPDWRIEN